MLETYTDEDGVERCDNCQEGVSDCACACSEHGDQVMECACEDGPAYPAVSDC